MSVTEPDPAFAELVAKLGPVFAEVAKAAVAESIAAVPTVSYRPGAVQGVSASARTASVLLDGDINATTVQVLGELPWTGARVMVKFVPPSAVFLDGIISASALPAGTLAPYAGPITVHADATTAQPTSSQPPLGWLWCAGQAVSRTTYSALFAAISTTYGTGDGSQTFNVPDLRGRTIIGLDNMGGTDAGRIGLANTLGTTGGSNVLTTGQLPSHSHTAGTLGTNTTGSHQHSMSNVVSSTQGVAAGVDYTGDVNTTTLNTGFAGDHSHTITGSTGSAGSGDEVLPPVMAVHWIIKA